jgi:hypothetical protein
MTAAPGALFGLGSAGLGMAGAVAVRAATAHPGMRLAAAEILAFFDL